MLFRSHLRTPDRTVPSGNIPGYTCRPGSKPDSAASPPVPPARAMLPARPVFLISPPAFDQVKNFASGRAIGPQLAGMLEPLRGLISLHVLFEASSKCCQIRIAPPFPSCSVLASLEFVADNGWVRLPVRRVPAGVNFRAQDVLAGLGFTKSGFLGQRCDARKGLPRFCRHTCRVGRRLALLPVTTHGTCISALG